MQKRSSKKKKPDDPNQLAKSIVDQVTSESEKDEAEPLADQETISKVMSEMGRRGGLKGGKARAESLTKEQRIDIAKRAAQARWEKDKK